MSKTNAARLLDSLGITYELCAYEVDPEDLTATNVARKINMPAEQVFKTLLTTTGPDQYVFAVIPGDAELDFKKLARAAEVRKAEMVALKDVQPLTGYIRGGVTVFGAKKDFPAFADETIELFEFLDDWSERYRQLIEMGEKLLPMPPELKTEANRVHGCQSTVHIALRKKPGLPRKAIR